VTRFILAGALLIHAVAHLPGFIVAWQVRLFEELPYRTTIFGTSLDIGAGGMRLIGVGWIAVAMLLAVLALAVATGVSLTPWAIPAVLALSLLLCAAGWPEARLGLVANALIGLGVAVAARYELLTVGS
jgi:hypothetical protein